MRGFLCQEKEESMFWFFHPLAHKQITNTYRNHFSRSFENCYTVEREKNWPIADRRVLSNDLRNNCGSHFASNPLLLSKITIYGGPFQERNYFKLISLRHTAYPIVCQRACLFVCFSQHMLVSWFPPDVMIVRNINSQKWSCIYKVSNKIQLARSYSVLLSNTLTPHLLNKFR